MKKIIIMLLSLIYVHNAFAIDTLAPSVPIVGTISEGGYGYEQIIFPNTSDGVKVDTTGLIANPNTTNMQVNGSFWIKSISESGTPEGGLATFEHGIGTQAKLMNNNDSILNPDGSYKSGGTFTLVGYAWNRNSGWIYFGDIPGHTVKYYRDTGSFIGDGWSPNLGRIPMGGNIKLVTTVPTTDFSNSPNDYFAANNNKSITINTPATIATGEIERYDSDIITSVYLSKNFSHNFQKAKDYSYTLTDEFGNKKTGVFHVVAGIPNIPSIGFPLDSKIGDGVNSHSISFSLVDQYSNSVINVSGVKTVSVDLGISGNIYKDQITNSGPSAIDFSSINSNFSSMNSIASSSDGTYEFSIKSLAPTYAGYNYTSSANNINITKLNYIVNKVGSYAGVGETSSKVDIYSVSNPSPYYKFTPAIKVSSISSEPQIILRDIETIFSAFVEKSTSQTINNVEVTHKLDLGTDPNINKMMSYQNLAINVNGGNESELCNGFNKGTGYSSNGNCNLISSKTSNIILRNNGLIGGNYTSSFVATPRIVTASLATMSTKYSSIISYVISGNLIKFPSFNDTQASANNSQVTVAGLANTGYEILDTSTNKTLQTFVDKAKLRAQIVKNVSSLVKSGTIPANVDYHTSDYTLSVWPTGKDVIIVDGADLIISGNLLKTVSKSKLNSIVVLTKNNVGGSIWIDKQVKFISAIIYANRHVISGKKSPLIYYANTNTGAVDQLFIKGSVISQNTIGGASKEIPTCPYPIKKTSCDMNTAKKYDFNHFRHFVNGTQGVSFVSGLNGLDNVDMSKIGYANSTVIIEYDNLVQSKPPSIFKVK